LAQLLLYNIKNQPLITAFIILKINVCLSIFINLLNLNRIKIRSLFRLLSHNILTFSLTANAANSRTKFPFYSALALFIIGQGISVAHSKYDGMTCAREALRGPRYI